MAETEWKGGQGVGNVVREISNGVREALWHEGSH